MTYRFANRRHLALSIATMVTFALIACSTLAAHPAYAQSLNESSDSLATAIQAQQISTAQVAQVKLDKKSVKIKNNGTVQLTATLVPDVAGGKIKDETVTWSISKPKIARISQDGTVQGKKTGTATVTATASNGVKATAKVKVKVNKSKMATRIPVMTYHRICSNIAKSRVHGGTNLAISASKFKAQMKWLKTHGYHTISTSEFKDWRVEGAFVPKKSVLLTIDDGFYETYHVALPILKKYNQKATLFVIGSKVKKTTKKYNPLNRSDRFVGWDVIKKVRKEYPNLEFQSHTYNMHHRNGSGNGVATSWSRSKIDKDFAKNEKFGFTAIAYPFGHASGRFLAATRAYKPIGIGFGYMMDWPASRNSPRYNIPRFKVFGDRGLGDFISDVRTAR